MLLSVCQNTTSFSTPPLKCTKRRAHLFCASCITSVTCYILGHLPARSLQIQLKLQLIKIFRCFICLKVLLPAHKVQKRKRQKTPWRKQRNFWHIKGEKYSASIFRKNVSRANEACNEEATNVTFFKSSSCLKGSKGGTTWNTATSKLETFISFFGATVAIFFSDFWNGSYESFWKVTTYQTLSTLFYSSLKVSLI